MYVCFLGCYSSSHACIGSATVYVVSPVQGWACHDCRLRWHNQLMQLGVVMLAGHEGNAEPVGPYYGRAHVLSEVFWLSLSVSAIGFETSS